MSTESTSVPLAIRFVGKAASGDLMALPLAQGKRHGRRSQVRCLGGRVGRVVAVQHLPATAQTRKRFERCLSVWDNEMDTNNSLLRRASLTSLAVLRVAFLVSCSFTGFPHPPQFRDNFEALALTDLSQRLSDAPIYDPIRDDKRPATLAGPLRYKLSSILRDKDGDRGPLRSHKATILGVKPTVSVAEKQTAPDLVPFSSSGNYRSAFCRIEQGRKLRVTVKNRGNDKAPASKTTVTFRDKSFSLDTPAIPMGGSVDLLFDVPVSCLRPFCSFKIMVDANSQVDELNMEGNNSASGGCIG